MDTRCKANVGSGGCDRLEYKEGSNSYGQIRGGVTDWVKSCKLAII